MFERYTESARRALFSARQEATDLGGRAIETGHMLIGITRAGDRPLAALFARRNITPEAIRAGVEERSSFRERISTSVEMPFTEEMHRVLHFAAEEADRLNVNFIGTEHMLLGLLREEKSVAASVLHGYGLQLDEIREIVRTFPPPPDALPPAASANLQLLEHIDRIATLVDELRQQVPNTGEERLPIERVLVEIDALRKRLGG